ARDLRSRHANKTSSAHVLRLEADAFGREDAHRVRCAIYAIFPDGEYRRRGQSSLSRQAFSAAMSASRPTPAASIVTLDHNFRIITSDFRIITPGAMGCGPVSDLTPARRANWPKPPGRFPRD